MDKRTKDIFLASSLAVIIVLGVAYLSFSPLDVILSINDKGVKEVSFCDSKLAQDAGFIPVKHKFFGYETCILPPNN